MSTAAAKKVATGTRKRARTQPTPPPVDPVDELAEAMRAYRALAPEYQAMVVKVDEARRRVVAACEAVDLRVSTLR